MKTNRSPTVDVIVPCYQYGRFLSRCVKSVLDQRSVNVRVLIIDDASSDETENVGKRLQSENRGVEYRRHEKNKGHIATYNEGIDWLAAKYMLLISADDYLLPDAFQRATSLMEKNPEVGFTFGKTVDLLGTNDVELTETIPNKIITQFVRSKEACVLTEFDFLHLFELAKSVNIIRTPTAIARTEVQKRIGGYRADLPHAGDLEMWLRFAASARVGIINDFQAVYRMHGANMQNTYYSQKNLDDLTQRRAAFDEYFRNCGPGKTEMLSPMANIKRSISIEAVGFASQAFNDNQAELSIKIARFARDTYPAICSRPCWLRLFLKQTLGLKTWRLLRGVLRADVNG